LASSHSGEDVHVRTLQGIYRRTGVSQSLLACGSEGMPLDALTASRLARDGEKAGPVRHMCSGQHTVSLLLSRLRGWDPTEYWKPAHPSQIAYRAAVAAVFDTPTASLRTAIDGCGVETYAFPLREIARAFAMLADPSSIPANDPRVALAPALTRIRDAMLANPELIGGRHDRLDTSMMKAAPGRLISKSGMEALRGVAILPGPRIGTQSTAASGLALKIEDGDGHDRGTWAASVEALRQVGALDGGALRDLARYHRPVSLDPHGRAAAEAVPDFELVPVGELIG
ncbi:MAG: asparaginase, partial [Candidatus Limnocylindrales bacterium]